MAEDEGREVPLVWVAPEEEPVLQVNQVVVQHMAQDEFILTFGHATPPMLTGDEETRRDQLERITYVPVRTAARIGLTRQRVAELIDVLQTNLARFDATRTEDN